jgi:hypothetical protein
MVAGTYEVAAEAPKELCPGLVTGPDQPAGCPALTKVFAEFNDRINHAANTPGLENYQRLPNAQGVMLVEDWQVDLKKITMRIIYDDPSTGERKTYERHIFQHRHHGAE